MGSLSNFEIIIEKILVTKLRFKLRCNKSKKKEHILASNLFYFGAIFGLLSRFFIILQ